MKRIINFVLLLFSTVTLCSAQQLMTSSLYDQQGNFFDPATVGTQKHGMIGASYRKMWSGIDGGPQTAIVFGSTYLEKANIGIGGYIYNDVTGPTKRTGLQTAYAYHISLNNGTALFSIGLEARLQQFSFDKAKLQASLGNDPVLGTTDSRIKGDAGLGIAYTNKTFQVGASVSQLVQTKLDFYSGNLSRTEEAKLYRHYYFHGNYKWDVDGNTKIIPNVLFIYLPNAPVEFQGGVRVEHKDLFWWGVGLRARQSWMLSAGVKLQKKFTIGYCFDMFSTPLSQFDNGSSGNEILLRYDFLK